MAIGGTAGALEQAALGAELAQRRAYARGWVSAALVATGPTLVVLLSHQLRAGDESLAFVLTAWGMAIGIFAAGVVAHQLKRRRYLDAILRYFAADARSPSLRQLARDSRWAPAGL